jgi:diaminobutyrate-2-oxoglutarate transaminase
LPLVQQDFRASVQSFIFDQSGRSYLDFLVGAGTLAYDQNDPNIKPAMLKYIEVDGILHSLDLHTAERLRFSRKFREVIFAPRGLDRVQFCGPTSAMPSRRH